MNPDLQALVNFALRTLELLDIEDQWSIDTLMEIAGFARDEDLLATGPGGYATRTPKAIELSTHLAV